MQPAEVLERRVRTTKNPQSHALRSRRLLEKTVRKSLKELKATFDQAEEGLEGELHAAMTCIAQSHSEVHLDSCVADALRCLDVIEASYRALNCQSNEIAQAHPGARITRAATTQLSHLNLPTHHAGTMQRKHDHYHVQLCHLPVSYTHLTLPTKRIV